MYNIAPNVKFRQYVIQYNLNYGQYIILHVRIVRTICLVHSSGDAFSAELYSSAEDAFSAELYISA